MVKERPAGLEHSTGARIREKIHVKVCKKTRDVVEPTRSKSLFSLPNTFINIFCQTATVIAALYMKIISLFRFTLKASDDIPIYSYLLTYKSKNSGIPTLYFLLAF